MNFATVICLQAHTAYMWDVESRRSQVNAHSDKSVFFCTKSNYWMTQDTKLPMKVIRCVFLPCCRCCCGQPAKFLRSWLILRGSFTKPCTQWGHISSARDTLWDSWTWPKKRCVEESLKKRWTQLLSKPTITFHSDCIWSCINCNSFIFFGTDNAVYRKHDFGFLFNQEFFDEWAIKLGEQEAYKGPKTPDGRVSPTNYAHNNSIQLSSL